MMVNLFYTLRQIILASQSPRRQQFLKDLGIEYLLYHDLLVKNQENTFSQSLGKLDKLDSNDKLNMLDRDNKLKSDDSLNNICSHDTPTYGLRAKDDKEERPQPLELPENYVFRAALGKVIDAMQALGFIRGDINHEYINKKEDTDTQAFLDSDKKELLNLSYSVEKHDFKSNVLCPAPSILTNLPTKLTVALPHTKSKEALKTPIFITADTIVALDNEILGKPYDEAHALDMLRRMVGREHRVLTTVCVADLEAMCIYSFTDIAHVHFAPWSIKLLEAYIETGDPMDKAGSYGIQGVGMFLSDGIQGSWDTVAGLPVAKLLELLLYCRAIGVQG